MVDTVLNIVLRGVFIAFGIGALIALLRWVRASWGERRERWVLRLALAMLALSLVYAYGHSRMLSKRELIEEGRLDWRRYGDPREAERSRGDVRGWILDCTGRPENALARYGVREGVVERVYPLGEGGANLVGGGRDADERDYTIERVFADRLREPRSFAEQGELHPVGTDMQLTLCTEPTRAAWNLLRGTGVDGTVIVQDVRTGAVITYTATGRPEDPPFGIRRYALPGSVFKLAVASLWYENEWPEGRLPCPAYIQVGRARIRNFESHEYNSLSVPTGVLRVSCNTGAIMMSQMLRDRLGVDAFRDAFQRYGFITYADRPPGRDEGRFWNTSSDRWARRLNPPQSRVKIREPIHQHEWGLISIGQGPVDVTPIAVSRFIQAIGNGGVMLQPVLEADRVGRGAEGVRVMKTTTAQNLMRDMLTVVDSGTAVSALPRLAGAQGWDLGGKTGTADIQGAPRPDGWFAGLMFEPGGIPRYSVVVYLRRGGLGGRAPAQIAAEMTKVMAAYATAAPRRAG